MLRSSDPARPGGPAKPGGPPAAPVTPPPRRFGWGRVAADASSPLTPRTSSREPGDEGVAAAAESAAAPAPAVHATDFADLPHHVLLQVMTCLAVGDAASWEERAVRAVAAVAGAAGRRAAGRPGRA